MNGGEEIMEWSACMSLLQGYLENSPLIVLGSGASMPYELPSMSGLAEKIRKSDFYYGLFNGLYITGNQKLCEEYMG